MVSAKRSVVNMTRPLLMAAKVGFFSWQFDSWQGAVYEKNALTVILQNTTIQLLLVG